MQFKLLSISLYYYFLVTVNYLLHVDLYNIMFCMTFYHRIIELCVYYALSILPYAHSSRIGLLFIFFITIILNGNERVALSLSIYHAHVYLSDQYVRCNHLKYIVALFLSGLDLFLCV